jgi:hypothetical protein
MGHFFVDGRRHQVGPSASRNADNRSINPCEVGIPYNPLVVTCSTSDVPKLLRYPAVVSGLVVFLHGPRSQKTLCNI